MSTSAADHYGVPTLHGGTGQQHQRTKSSVLRSLLGHKRNNSDGTALASAPLTAPTIPLHVPCSAIDLNPGHHALASKESIRALGELQQNQQDQGQRQRLPERPRDRGQAPPSPSKGSTFATISLKSLTTKDLPKLSKSKEPSSPTKPKKTKSSTNLGAFLSRPKSIKNLKQLLSDEEARSAKDKENRTPPSSLANDFAPPPPIYAQFSSQHFGGSSSPSFNVADPFGGQAASSTARPAGLAAEEGLSSKQRPKSFQAYSAQTTANPPSMERGEGRFRHGGDDVARKRMTWAKGGHGSHQSSKHPLQGLGVRSKSATSIKSEPFIDPKDLDKHLEAMLDRRNIPENQRYKMRNLNDTIKLEFIRQDWAEDQAKLQRPSSNEGRGSTEGSATGPSDGDDGKKKKHTRGLSLTIGKSANKAPNSPTKKQRMDSNLGRHFRSKSTESVASVNISPAGETPSNGGFFAKVKGQQRPTDFVAYLRKVQKPELVEVGKLHKLRLLLRNETVAWTEEFIQQGGMEEIVGLLHRIMAVEWR